MSQRTFGPAVFQEDGRLVASCTWCTFRVHRTCTHVTDREDRDVSARETPDWCELKADMLRDAAELIAKDSTADGAARIHNEQDATRH